MGAAAEAAAARRMPPAHGAAGKRGIQSGRTSRQAGWCSKLAQESAHTGGMLPNPITDGSDQPTTAAGASTPTTGIDVSGLNYRAEFWY